MRPASEGELAALTSPEALAALLPQADLAWRQDASPEFADLLEARPVTE